MSSSAENHHVLARRRITPAAAEQPAPRRIGEVLVTGAAQTTALVTKGVKRFVSHLREITGDAPLAAVHDLTAVRQQRTIGAIADGNLLEVTACPATQPAETEQPSLTPPAFFSSDEQRYIEAVTEYGRISGDC